MRKFPILILLAMMGTANALAQSMADVFMKMPAEVCPLLNEYNRLEIVDNQKNGKEMKTKNQLFGTSEMKVLTANYAFLQTTKNSTKEMKMLNKADGGKVIMVISTVVSDGVYDSTVDFYDTNWKVLNTADFVNMKNDSEFNHMTISQDSDELTVYQSNPLLLNFDNEKAQTDLEIENARMKWNGKKFE